MLLHTKLAVLDYYFSTQRKFFHQMNSALALGRLRLSELSSIPSHVMGKRLHMHTYFFWGERRTTVLSQVAAAKKGQRNATHATQG